jgi:hypothetical protein
MNQMDFLTQLLFVTTLPLFPLSSFDKKTDNEMTYVKVEIAKNRAEGVVIKTQEKDGHVVHVAAHYIHNQVVETANLTQDLYEKTMTGLAHQFGHVQRSLASQGSCSDKVTVTERSGESKSETYCMSSLTAQDRSSLDKWYKGVIRLLKK